MSVAKGTVILLHGLARSSSSMRRMQDALEGAGFATCNVAYPSTRHSISTLASDYVLPRIVDCDAVPHAPLNFVTHSMGGIIVRYLARFRLIEQIARVVMLSPPNQGTEVVDALGGNWLFDLINGPAGKELATTKSSLPKQLGPAHWELGIITGDRSINWFLSLLIDGKNDGKISLDNAKLEGMKDFLVVHASHPFIMKRRVAIAQTIHFLEHGWFLRNGDHPSTPLKDIPGLQGHL